MSNQRRYGGRRIDALGNRRKDDDEEEKDDKQSAGFLSSADSIGRLSNPDTISSKDSRSIERTITAAHMLRRILEDYLEVDASADAHLHDLLMPELLVRYFHRLHVDEAELIFDVDQRAEKVGGGYSAGVHGVYMGQPSMTIA